MGKKKKNLGQAECEGYASEKRGGEQEKDPVRDERPQLCKRKGQNGWDFRGDQKQNPG